MQQSELTSTIILQLLQGPIWLNNSKMRASVTSRDRFPTYLHTQTQTAPRKREWLFTMMANGAVVSEVAGSVHASSGAKCRWRRIGRWLKVWKDVRHKKLFKRNFILKKSFFSHLASFRFFSSSLQTLKATSLLQDVLLNRRWRWAALSDYQEGWTCYSQALVWLCSDFNLRPTRNAPDLEDFRESWGEDLQEEWGKMLKMMFWSVYKLHYSVRNPPLLTRLKNLCSLRNIGQKVLTHLFPLHYVGICWQQDPNTQ